MQVPKGGNGVRIKFALYIRASGRTIVSSLRRSWNVWGTGRNGGTLFIIPSISEQLILETTW